MIATFRSFLRTENVAGAGVFLLTFVVLWMIYTKPELADHDLFKTVAQAIIVQGLIGLAMASWFTKRPRGDEPQSVQIDQPPDNPVPVHEEK